MPLHHLLTRTALLIMGLWAGGGFFLLGYCGLLYNRYAPKPATRAATHVAAGIAPYSGTRDDIIFSVRSELRSSAAPRDVRNAQASQAAIAPGVRAGTPIQFQYAATAGLVSVIIPTHDRARIIGRAVESALAQTYTHLEVVVADDGSSDNTREVVEAYGSRVIYARQANAGVSAARNFGMRNARGEFIAFLDSDDAWQPWKIEAQINALTRHPEAGLVWTDMAAMDERDRVLDQRYLRTMYSAYEDVHIEQALPQVDVLGALSTRAPQPFWSAAVREGDLSSRILLGNLVHTSTVLFRRSSCERTGGFDESFARAGEDYEFYIRLCSAGPVVFIDAPSTLYRIGVADQLTRPSMILEIARNNLRAIERWASNGTTEGQLPPSLLRRRFAESFAWVGEAELDAGHPLIAARRLSKSLALMPGFDRRALLLASCVLPSRLRDRLRSARAAIRASASGGTGGGSAA